MVQIHMSSKQQHVYVFIFFLLHFFWQADHIDDYEHIVHRQRVRMLGGAIVSQESIEE